MFVRHVPGRPDFVAATPTFHEKASTEPACGIAAARKVRGNCVVGGSDSLWASRTLPITPFRSRCEPHHATVNPLGPQSKRFAMWSIAVLSVIAAALIAAGFSAGFPDK